MKKIILLLIFFSINFTSAFAHQPKLIKYSPSPNKPHEVIDPEISKVYENKLADNELKKVGEKLRFEFNTIKKLNKTITPREILKQRKKFRTSVIVRNIYTEVLNILQADVMKKLKNNKKKKNKKFLEDAMMTSIAGISAAMKNTR